VFEESLGGGKGSDRSGKRGSQKEKGGLVHITVFQFSKFPNEFRYPRGGINDAGCVGSLGYGGFSVSKY